MTDLPDYYFRIRDNGAAVFRMSAENRHNRIEMTEIAAANLRNGNIRAHGTHVLTEAERQAIEAWMDERRVLMAARELDDIHRTIDHLNHTAHWAQARATDAELEEVTDRLLLAMHDLRAVLVRRKADRLGAGGDQSGE
ncbi:hypothetical protein P6F26_08545 [Roseibacterium sp. SDUM158017]|uniref:hypothetical protein n=1 Tax=Roseicyclus salinarum TaxID=3036773 RepID=UPI002414F589|nr:hypothetical protein [Roseibacterium sp. SDUM158017]MDG4648493.1 hypothetical protein [Roseibacterium sp. SDUM158017]